MAMIIYEPKKIEKNMWAASFMSEEVANKKVLQYEHVTLTNREIHLLKGPRFLNDIIIEFFFLHLSNHLLHLHESFRDDILLVSPTLSYFLQQGGEDHIVDFVKSHGVTTKQIVIFTVNNNPDGGRNDGGSHWSLLVYYRKHDKFVHYDSLGNNGSFARKLYRAVKKHVGEAPPESETTNEDGDPNSSNNDTSTINGINGVDGSNSTSLICGESSINETNGVGDSTSLMCGDSSTNEINGVGDSTSLMCGDSSTNEINGVGDSTSLMCGDSSTNEINGVGDSNSTRMVEGDSGVSEEKAAEKNGDNSIVHVDSSDDVEGGNSIVHVDSTDDVEGDNPKDIEKCYGFRGGWYLPEEEKEEEFRWRPWLDPYFYYHRTWSFYDQRRKRSFSYRDRDCDGNQPFYRRNNIDENFKEERCMPRQKNYYDCGLYVMRIAEVICEWYYSDEDTKRKEPQHGQVDGKGWFPNINGHMDTSVESTMRRDILEIIQQRASEAGIVLELFSEDDDDTIDTLLQLSDDTKDVKEHAVSVELDDKTPLPQVSSGYLNDLSDDETPLPQPQQCKSDDETIEDCGDICGEKDVALPPQQEQCMSDDDETL